MDHTINTFMRKLINLIENEDDFLIEAVAVPETSYGYWISPEGEIIPVPGYSHTTVIKQHTNHQLNSDTGLEKGWLRCILYRKPMSDNFGFAVECRSETLTARSIISLAAIARSQEFSEYEADVWSGHRLLGRTPLNFKVFLEERAFMNYVRRCKNESNE
jgi:hypothetical protein